jgi:hypothetical protein
MASSGLLCTPTTLEFPTIDHTNIVCFESHLMCGLNLPPSKFLVAILNYLGVQTDPFASEQHCYSQLL